MNRENYELSVLVNGHPIREYGHNGETYVAAHHQAEYSLRFRNNSSVDVLAIISIDGLGVVDGQPATEDSRGYIVPAFSSYEIKGWRTSLNDVAKFRFDKKGKSYAQQMGNAKNCGVIGCRVYPQKIVTTWYKTSYVGYPPVWTPPIDAKPYYADPLQPYKIYCGGVGEPAALYSCTTSSDSTSNMKFDMGTAFGNEINDNVSEKSFERGNLSYEFVIYYASIDQLQKMGIEIEKKTHISVPTKPKPFADFCRRPAKNV